MGVQDSGRESEVERGSEGLNQQLRGWSPDLFEVGEHVKFREDDVDEGVGIVRRSGSGKVWVETLFNMWRAADPAWFVRTTDALPPGLEEGSTTAGEP